MRSALAIGLVSAAVLVYEVAVTRVLSVVLWYHFAFLAVSLAMLGASAPGVTLSLVRFGDRTLRRALFAAAVLVPLSIVAVFQIGAVLAQRETNAGAPAASTWRVVLVVASVLPPLGALGTAICVLLVRAGRERIARMYGADLLGATLGALVVVPLLAAVPTPVVLAGAGLLPLAAYVLVGGSRALAGGAAALLVALLAWGAPLSLRWCKGYYESRPVLFERWTPTARLTVFETPFWTSDPRAAFGWGMGSKWRPAPLEQLWLEQDGNAGTPITRLETKDARLPHLLFDVTSVGYQLFTPKTVCIIGAGGGRDILTAREAGAVEIDAVELNAATVAALAGPFAAFSGDVYHLPGVRAHVAEGRSFLARAAATWDLVQISLIDTWAATAAGAYALSESYLYTEEAMSVYWDRLAEDGVASITRWIRGSNRVESLRLSLLARDALERRGVSEPTRHLAVVEAGNVATLLVTKRAFDDTRLAALDRICEERGFVRRFPVPAGGVTSEVSDVLAEGASADAARGLDLRPPTDDRPFFFHSTPLFAAEDPARPRSGEGHDAVRLLETVIVVVGGVAALVFLAPLVLARRLARAPGGGGARFWRGSVYFAAIGVAFMLVEATWIQRFILYLGHPSYATTAVLGTLLLGAGLGSLVATRASRVGRPLTLGLPLVVLAVQLALGPVFAATLGWSFAARVAVTIGLLAPAGFVMGLPFPLGMTRLAAEGERAWLWAVNGVMSVLATVLSLVLAMTYGFRAVVLAGVACYALAALLLPAAAPVGAAHATEPEGDAEAGGDDDERAE